MIPALLNHTHQMEDADMLRFADQTRTAMRGTDIRAEVR